MKKLIIVLLALFVATAIPSFAQVVGDECPVFALQSVTGNTFDTNMVVGKKLVLVWFTNFDDASKNALADLSTLYQSLDRSKVEFVAISLNGTDDSLPRKMFQEFGVPFPILIDPDGNVCQLFTKNYLPELVPKYNLFVVGINGKYAQVEHLPGVPVLELEKYIKSKIAEIK
ncbi:MAG: peroxiredoxin family protein [Chloroflexi bacterium]|nr:peroxiredoxin family protein [Chloroflexota bacterium]